MAPDLASAGRFGVQVAVDAGDHHVKKFDLGAAWEPGLYWWQIGDWHLALIGEAHAAWWHIDEGNVHGDIGVTPVIRFIKISGWVRPFVEVAAGIRLLSSPPDCFGPYARHRVPVCRHGGRRRAVRPPPAVPRGLRFQHISNGGIKEPNPGINFSQLYLQYNF
ncbi:acyloxyacyl hydrolase [Paraburkholderia strydomiana]